MDYDEDRFLNQNAFISEKLDHLIHIVEHRLDKFYRNGTNSLECIREQTAIVPYNTITKDHNLFSSQNLSTFKSPYIRDFRNFSGPQNDDVKHIQQLTFGDNIDSLVKSKSWTKETQQQLKDAVLDFYSKLHIIKLIKQKNQLLSQQTKLSDEDISQKMQLIDEQSDQVKARKEPRIFVPEDRLDKQIDWCAISAKLAHSHHDAQDCRLMWSNQLHWVINDTDWSPEEDCCLINAVAKHGKNDWDSVASELNNGRLAWQCCARYNQHYAYLPMPLEKDETSKIIEVINLCRIGNYVPWNQVMYFIQYHHLHQVKYQWQKYCSEQRDATAWTRHEDYLLLRAIERYGEKEWCRVADAVPGRTNKSCRERYTMRLKFQTRILGSWRRGEDVKLMSLVEQYGTNWSLIESNFQNRNCHQLRNRFELLKNQVLKQGPIKHRKFHRSEDGEFVNSATKPRKFQSEIEVDRRLQEIFTTYSSVNKSSKKLICRSAQDEVIYQTLVNILCDILLKRDRERLLLDTIIYKAIDPKLRLLMPSIPTLKAYKAWSILQGYLNQTHSSTHDSTDDKSISKIDERVVELVVSIFLWPAILARMKPPIVDVSKYQVGSIIERDSKNLYKIRDIQQRITR